VSEKVTSPRFTLLDGLRGLAAFSVVCYHIGAAGKPRLRDVGPWPLTSFLFTGYLGVPVFFVVSGFTIAWSLRNVRMSGTTFGRFLLRRSLRLDPPFWVAIVLTILLPYQKSAPVPSLDVVAANAFYVADLLRIPKLNSVYWTLFLELQFYGVLAGLLWLAAAGAGRRGWRSVVLAVLAALFLLSLLEPATHWPEVRGLFVTTWYAFFAGACLAWFHAGRLKPQWLLAVAIPVALYAALRQTPFPVVVLATGLLIFVAHQKEAMGSWLGGPIVQYLGRISYSLYLIHGPAGQHVTKFASRLGASPTTAAVAALAGLTTSLLAAHLLWWLVEVPSMRWSRSIRL
jgi:peptidoglycan/LPS O-acetylase OafA/YrhL